MNLRRKTTSGRYIPEADGIRFVAIMLVLVYHATLPMQALARGSVIEHPFGAVHENTTSWHLWDHVLNQGQFGVHLFFTLSGFILALPFVTGRPSLKKYYKRRLTRLEPPYLLALTICFLFAPSLVWHYLGGLFYGHILIFHYFNPLNAPLWSLEIEIEFYLLLPLLATLFLVRDVTRRRLTIMAAIVLSMLIESHFANTIGYFPRTLGGVMQFFLVGFLFADVYVNDWHQQPSKHAAWDAVFVASAATFLVAGQASWFFNVLPVIGFLTFCAAFRGPVFSRFLANMYVATIGGMAYSIYLLHFPLMALLARHTPLNIAIFSLILIGASLLAGLAFFVLIERPCMEPDWPSRVRAMIGRRFRAQVSAGAREELGGAGLAAQLQTGGRDGLLAADAGQTLLGEESTPVEHRDDDQQRAVPGDQG